MKTLWGVTVAVGMLWSAADTDVCRKLRASVAEMDRATQINRRHVLRYYNAYGEDTNLTRKQKAYHALERMNDETKTRAKDVEYPTIYEELKQGFLTTCGRFDGNDEATVRAVVERSVAFNRLLAAALQEPMALRKVIEGKDLNDTAKRAASFFSEINRHTGIAVLLEHNGVRIKAAAGLADRKTRRAYATDTLFEIGSASKVLTGIAVFQLIEQGKLSLDTPITTFYPSGEIRKLGNFNGKNYFDNVTVGMLLNHTSGFIDYLNVYNDDAKALEVYGGKGKRFTFEELIRIAVSFGDANFKPGTRHRYSNTGYLILGDIVSKVTKRDWRDYVQRNILDKVGMKHTYFGSRMPERLRHRMPKGYMRGKETFMPPTLAGSAGEIVSTLDDLAMLLQAWSGGKLYAKPETLRLQLTQGFHPHYPGIRNILYGYAIMKTGPFYGHGGQTFGFQTYMAIDPDTNDTVIVSANDATVTAMSLFFALTGMTYER